MPDPLSFSLLLLALSMPTVLVTVAMLHVNKRLALENRELLKANLALSGKPEASALAGLMEGTDRAVQTAAHADRQPQRPLRQVGS